MPFEFYKIFHFPQAIKSFLESRELEGYERDSKPYRIDRNEPVYSSSYEKIDEAMKKLIAATRENIHFDYFLAPGKLWNAQARLIGNQCKVLIYTGLMNFQVYNEKEESITLPATFFHELSHCTSEDKETPYGEVKENLSTIGSFLGALFGKNELRQKEYKADYYGMMLLAKSCQDPVILRDYYKGVMEGFQQKGIRFSMSTNFSMSHPSFPDRIKFLEEHLPIAQEVYETVCKK